MIEINGLDAFDLTRAAFVRLRTTGVAAQLSLDTYKVTPDVTRLPPKERHLYLGARVLKWILLLRRRFPGTRLTLDQADPSDGVRRRSSALPNSIMVRTTPRQLLALAAARGVGHVYVTAIQGFRRRRTRAPSTTWYCVRALVAIAIEGQVRGMQTTEDRFVILRASSFDDAVARLKPHWREYATPYLNRSGQVVRWQLEKIVDVYQTDEDEIDPAGTELYSRLGQRRLRPRTTHVTRNK